MVYLAIDKRNYGVAELSQYNKEVTRSVSLLAISMEGTIQYAVTVPERNGICPVNGLFTLARQTCH